MRAHSHEPSPDLRTLVLTLIAAAAVLLASTGRTPAQSAPATLPYETGFEISENFDSGFTLVGQGGWVGSDNGGNGLTSGYFEEGGQHAFVGFTPPEDPAMPFVNLWRPVRFAPAATSNSIVQFSVRMQIVASTNQAADDFRWSVYNDAGARLFTVDFDGSSRQISYSLDQPTDFVSTNVGFDTAGWYDLQLWMDFRRNAWSAWLNESIIVNSQPMTAANAALNLGDVDAVWAIRQPKTPGNNYMVFDDYRIVVEPISSLPIRLEQLGISQNGAFLLRVYGQTGLSYAVEATSDWKQWQPIKSFKAPAGGIFDFEDPDALRTEHRFLRVRQLPDSAASQF